MRIKQAQPLRKLNSRGEDTTCAQAALQRCIGVADRLARNLEGRPAGEARWRLCQRFWLASVRGSEIADPPARLCCPHEIRRWLEHARAALAEHQDRARAAGRRRWREWVKEAAANRPGKLYRWLKGESWSDPLPLDREGGGGGGYAGPG